MKIFTTPYDGKIRVTKYDDLSPTQETDLSEVVVALHPHKERIRKCRNTIYIIRPCYAIIFGTYPRTQS